MKINGSMEVCYVLNKYFICLSCCCVHLQEPPNLCEMLKPIQNASSPASLGLKDEDDDDGEGEDGDGDGEKADPANVNPERLKAFNVRSLMIQRAAILLYFCTT